MLAGGPVGARRGGVYICWVPRTIVVPIGVIEGTKQVRYGWSDGAPDSLFGMLKAPVQGLTTRVSSPHRCGDVLRL